MATMLPVSVHKVGVSFCHGINGSTGPSTWQIKIFSASLRHVSFDHILRSKCESKAKYMLPLVIQILSLPPLNDAMSVTVRI